MNRVMIVEDEILVRSGLKNTVDWGKFRMNVSYEASDGQAAWDIYRKEKPDLIITDLKMPVMDGMALISKIREEDDETPIIILSCLDQFDLVCRALTLKVSDYIFKLSMSEEQLESVLERARIGLDKKKSAKADENGIPAASGAIKERILQDYLFEYYYSDREFAILVERLKLRLSPRGMTLCVLAAPGLPDSSRTRFAELVAGAVEEEGNGESFERSGGKRHVLLLSHSSNASEHEAKEAAARVREKIRHAVQNRLGVSVHFAASEPFDGYERLREKYDECGTQLDDRLFFGGDDARELEAAIASRKHFGEEFAREMKAELALFSERPSVSKEEAIHTFVNWLHYASVLTGLKGTAVHALTQSYGKRLNGCDTMLEAIRALSDYLDELDATRKTKRLSKEMAEAMKFMQERFKEELSLKQVADQVALSPNYLTSLFKKELNVSFIKYLIGLRVDEAKRLLRGTNLKAYEIACEAGFNDESYFSRVFRNATGMSPGEYREMNAADGFRDAAR